MLAVLRTRLRLSTSGISFEEASRSLVLPVGDAGAERSSTLIKTPAKPRFRLTLRADLER